MAEERTGSMDAAYLLGLSHVFNTGALTTSKRLLNNRQSYLPLMLVSVVTDALSCVVAWQLMTGALCKIRVAKKIAMPLFACCGANEMVMVKEVCRKIHEHRGTSLSATNEAGSFCGAMSVHSVGLL